LKGFPDPFLPNLPKVFLDMKTRRVISLTVLLSFVFLALSGIVLFFSPQGRVAYWAGWTIFGLSKDQYTAIHTTFMTLFLVAGIWHIVLNWKPIVGYLKDRSKKIRVFRPESSLALGLTILFFVGPLTGLPPFKQFLDAGAGVKAYWEKNQGSPPWGHAEESTLDAFCRRIVDFHRWEEGGVVVVDCADAQAALAAAGIQVEGPSQLIIDMARANSTTPQVLADIILSVARPATPEEISAGLGGGQSGGEGRGGGRGGERRSGPGGADRGSDPRF